LRRSRSAQRADLVEHPLEQGLGGGGGSTGSVELEDFPTLAANLPAHALDLTTNELDIRHGNFPKH